MRGRVAGWVRVGVGWGVGRGRGRGGWGGWGLGWGRDGSGRVCVSSLKHVAYTWNLAKMRKRVYTHF
jgi:hypothetical protein